MNQNQMEMSEYCFVEENVIQWVNQIEIILKMN